MAKTVGDNQPGVSRTSVAIIALGCLAGAGALWIADWQEAHWELWKGALFKVGLVMSAFWLGMPTATRPAAWANMPKKAWVAIAILVAVILRVPVRFVLPLCAFLFAAAVLLKPRGKQRPVRPSRPSARSDAREQPKAPATDLSARS